MDKVLKRVKIKSNRLDVNPGSTQASAELTTGTRRLNIIWMLYELPI